MIAQPRPAVPIKKRLKRCAVSGRRRALFHHNKEIVMADINQIKKNAEVIGADGVHVGTVDHVDGKRLKLTKKDSIDDHHHYIDGGLIADIANGRVRLSANANVAITLEDDK
jgi:hypothetical protein